MGQALNTQVNGSAGTCEQAADWLRKMRSQAQTAASKAANARRLAEAGWRGPAADEYFDATVNVSKNTDDVADRARKYESALRDFADSLRAINAKMDDALSKARADALRVEGPIILSPEAPAAPKTLPTGPCGTEHAQRIMEQNYQAQQEYQNGPLAEYNRKASVYNTCKSIVSEARKLEKDANHDLRQRFGYTGEDSKFDPSNGVTIASHVRNFVGDNENSRRLAAAKAERLMTQSKFLNNFALGVVGDINPAQTRILERAAKLADDGGKQFTRAQQFEKCVKVVPERVRDIVSRYPAQKAAEQLAEHSNMKLPQVASSMLRSTPYVGALLTASSEAIGAAKGEESWGRAAADTGAAIAGGWIGGALTGAVAGSAFSPLGSVILGTIGGIGGASFAQDIVAGIAGDEG